MIERTIARRYATALLNLADQSKSVEAVETVVFRPGGQPQRITVSIGIAALTPERDTVSRVHCPV